MQDATPPRVHNEWKTYAFWFFLISIVFFTVYPLCNWLTAQRDSTFELYITRELAFPLIPQFIWIYLSLYLLFLIPPFFLGVQQMNALGRQLIGTTFFCGAVFLLLPARLGFERTIPDDPFYGPLFAGMFDVDLPHNLVPSLHVAFSALILITLLNAVKSTVAKTVFGAWLVLLSVSTVLVHQHHLIDVVTGFIVAVAFYRFIGRGEKNV
jgi:membrane-associated phospholipid phosphatase